MDWVIRVFERLGRIIRWRVQMSIDMGEEDYRGAKAVSAAVSKETSDRFGEVEEQLQLLPGIPDDITLGEIAPRLPWGTFYILESVSRRWQQAIESRQVYDARVHSQSTEALVMINHFRSANGHAFGLYSSKEKSFYQLPVIPYLELEVQMTSRWVLVDGKLYVLGGVEDGTRGSVSDKMFVMDLAGHGQWGSCASMNHARRNFGCGVLHGRIYIYGGFSHTEPTLVSEVYDPKLDSWSLIESMTAARTNHQVIEVTALRGVSQTGDEGIFVHGTQMLVPDEDDDEEEDDSFLVGGFFEFYSPIKNEWNEVKENLHCYNMFMAEGEIILMDTSEIHVYDVDQDSWTHNHSYSLPAAEHGFGIIEPWTTLAVDKEFATIRRRLTYYGRGAGQYLLHRLRFGSTERNSLSQIADCYYKLGEEKNIMWKLVDCSYDMGDYPVLSALHL